MQKLNFFTPIAYTTPSKSIGSSLLENVDSYFYLGGKKAHVIQGRAKNGQEKAVLYENVDDYSCIAGKRFVCSYSRPSEWANFGKVLSYFTIVIPLLMLTAKAVLRSNHSFKLIDPKQKLEKGMNISDEIAAKIVGLMPKILLRKKDNELEWLSTGNILVFKLVQHPEFVFKVARPKQPHPNFIRFDENTDSRFEKMVEAKAVCMVNELGLLIIPHAKKFTVNAYGNNYAFIAEESLDFDPNESAQEELYHKYSQELNETVLQLATFVAKTGFDDVAWRKIPILNEAQESQDPRRIALINLENMMGSRVKGFIGNDDFNRSRGLIRCVSKEQIDNVIAEARKQGVAITGEQARCAKNHRLQELEDDRALRTLYEKKGIITGKEPIQVDIDSLGLDLAEEGQIKAVVEIEEDEFKKALEEHEFKKALVAKGVYEFKWKEQTFFTCEEHFFKLEKQTVTLRKVTEDVIAELNRLIQVSSDQASTKRKRYVVLGTHTEPFDEYDQLGIPPGMFIEEKQLGIPRGMVIDEKQLWLYRIVAALVEKGHILKLDKVNKHGYFIQA